MNRRIAGPGATTCSFPAAIVVAWVQWSCSAPPMPASEPGDARHAALAALEAATGHPWKARWTADSIAPALLQGRTPPLLGGSGNSPATATWRFLLHHPELFPIDAQCDELVSTAVDTDDLGMVHLRLRRRHQGVTVHGDWLGVHFAADGALVRIEGRFVPIEGVDRAAPLVSAGAVAATALAALGAGADVRTPSLVLDLAPGSRPGVAAARLAWRVEALALDAAEPARSALFLDAGSGEVYRRDELLDTLHGSGIGVFGDRRDLEVAVQGSRFVLEDRSRGSPPQRVSSSRNAARAPGTPVVSARPDRWDEVGDGRGAAVDAAAHLQIVEDYFQRVHGRRGAQDRGAGMQATVHFGRSYTGAFWDGRELVFGDGDGKTVAPLSAGLDIVAHEFVHAVIEASSDLGHRAEAGALAEGFADTFACFVERAARGAEANWSIGEAVTIDGFPGFRDLADPRRTGDPVHTDDLRRSAEDRGEIHANSTIVGHAAYLISEGGTDPRGSIPVAAIEAALVERIWYRALTRYLGPGADFTAAADATLAAAVDLAGPEAHAVVAVDHAWRAVGVQPTP